MTPNSKPSELLSILGSIDPISQGAGTVTSGYVSVKNHLALMALISTGVMGASGTIDAKLQQAQDSGGTGVKDVTGKAIVQILKAAGDNKQALINLKVADLDTEGGFGFVRLSITVGTAASLVGGYLYGMHPRYEDASAFNQAGTVQVI